MEKTKSLARRIKCGVLVFGVIIIPLFYSFFYLDAFWDPYSKLDTVPVAVVNNDTGATINGEFRNLGDQLVNTLKDEKSLKWVFTNDKDAADGMQTGKKYYAVITIPKDFSSKIATADSTNKEEAAITYSSNEKRNYLATQILHSATIQLEEKLRAQVTEEITGQLVDKLNEVPTQLNKLDDGLTQLNDGTVTLGDGMTKLNSGAQSITSNLGTLKNGLGKAYTGSKTLSGALFKIPTLTAGITTLNSGAGTLSGGLNQAAAGAAKLNSGAAAIPTLNAGITKLDSGASQVFAGSTTLSKGTSDLLAGTTTLSKGTSDLLVGTTKLSAGATQLSVSTQQYVQTVNIIMATVKKYSNDTAKMQADYGILIAAEPNLTDTQQQDLAALQVTLGFLSGDTTVTKRLSDGGTSLTAGAAGLAASVADTNTAVAKINVGAAAANTGAAQVNAGAARVNGGAKQVSDGAAQLKASEAKLTELQKGISDLNTALAQLNAGGKQVSDGTAALAANTAQLKQLQAGVNELSAALAKMKDGSSQLYDGSKTLQTGISDAKDGTAKLQNGITTAKTGVEDSIKTAKEDLKATDGLDKYSGEAVSVKSNPTNPVPNYGTAFAPYFLSLSMWVGALMMLFGIYLDPGKRIKHLAKGSDSRFIRIVAFFCIGIAQSILLAIVLQAGLGLKVNNVVPYYFAIILGSMTFISIVQFCVVNLGDIGKFLAILFLILQLTSCGGTFPMETVPQIFNALYKFMPMTYTVELLREVISGNDMAYAWRNALVLIGVVLVFAALTVLFAFYKRAKQRRLSDITITEVNEIHV